MLEQDLELELLEFGINFYHLVSLLWNRTTRKHTDEFLIYKTRELIEILLSNIDYQQVDDLILRMEKADEIIKSIPSTEQLFMAMGVEIDNHINNEFGISIEFKLSIILHLLKLRGITEEQIFEKYQN